MEENNNDERTILDKGKEIAKKKAKQKANKWLIKVLPKILPVLGIFFGILLLAGLLLAGQQLIQNLFNAIIGVLNPEDDVVQMNHITTAAQQVHDAEMTWDYIDDTENTRLAKIKQNIENALNQTEDPGTNCSTYVSCALYKAGCFSASEISKWNYISPNGLEGCLLDAGWPRLTKEEYLRPGDIVFFGPGVGQSVHVQIYAGGDMWYNAGTVLDIQDEAPKNKGNWKAGYDSWWAYRCPDLLEQYPIPEPLITIDEKGAYKTNVEKFADQILAELERQKVNNEVTGFDTDALGDMIEKYIRTEIKTSNIKTEHKDNEEDGIIVIKRASVETGTIIDLKYVEYKRFCERVEKQDEVKLKSDEVPILKSFSINPETFDLCIAKMNDSVYIEHFGGGSSTTGGGISMEEINFKKYVKNNATPLNFLIVLHLISQDVEFMEDVVDLALGEGKINPIELTYVDSRFVTTIQYDYSGRKTEVHNNCSGVPPIDINNTNVPNYYDVGFHIQTTTRYTYKLYVTNADTWLTSTSKSISQKANTTGGTNEGPWTLVKQLSGSSKHKVTEYRTSTNEAGEQIVVPYEEDCYITEGGYVKEKITTSTANTEFTVVDKVKQIKVDDFVELIKKYPKVENNFTTTPSNIFYLLQQDASTHWHERVMRYVLFKLTDIDYGVIDGELDGLLRDDLNKIGGGGDILNAAQIVHDEQMSWKYYTDISQLQGDIVKARYNPNKVTCCSTYVSTVLHVANIFTKEEMETPVYGNIGFNSPIWVDVKLAEIGWEKITNASDLQAGDIVLMDREYTGNPTHVQIYAGDNTWYNAGATMYIQAPAPYEDANWEHKAGRWWAYRPPKRDTSVQGIPGKVLETAQIVHEAQRTAIYTTDYEKTHNGSGGLVYRDIEKSFKKATEVTCCATYVSHVLWKAGYFTTEEMNKIGYNYQVEVSKLLKKSGWQKIEEESQLQAGDIVFMDKSGDEHSCNHVQIYAGDGKWYNAGNTEDIQGPAPKQGGSNWMRGFDRWWAYRPPILEQK